MALRVDGKFLQDKALLFKGATAQEAVAMLGCLGATARSYDKGEYIYHMGQNVRAMGLVLEGGVRVENSDVWGNVSVLSHVGPGHVFAETYAAVPDEPIMVDVVAAEDCRILFMDMARVLRTCPHGCAHHQAIINNLVAVLARKNLGLSQRVFVASPKTIRGKVLSYLSFEASRTGSNEFDIPFNRQQLADYLGVDRSALSAELSRMQKEGILETRRSHFALKE